MSEASKHSGLDGSHGRSNSRGADTKDNRKEILNNVDIDIITDSELLASK